MIKIKRSFLLILGILFFIFSPKYSYSETQNIYELLELIQKDLRTLEKAVYSDNFSASVQPSVSSSTLDQNSEEVLTRHLLKLSEIEKQFQELTNKSEEINFKLDKLSTRMTKFQADNQVRFQQLENQASTINVNKDQQVSSLPKEDKEEFLPGSSQPQDLGSISYKDTEKCSGI